tara:strand:+ start:1702 stop:2970 length:1269 start_codon:yes stop_codon:yes gene_type:complete
MENIESDLISTELPKAWATSMDTFIAKAKNAEIWDQNGNRFLDFVGGYAVLNTGHLHPTVMSKVQEQLNFFSHSCFAFAPHEKAVELSYQLNRRYPIEEKTKTFLVNSGAEAVENAIKISKHFTKRQNLISFTGGFHGRTHMALGLTGKDVPYKEGFGPFPKEIYHTTYPYVYRGVTTENAIEELDNLLSTKIKPEETAAIIIEPVLGEGGYIPCEKEFIQYLRNICDQNGIILIFDEVQTGFGRTGKMFGAEHFEVEPDIVTLAKGIAGGFPLASVTGKSDIMDSPKESGLGTTFGASPISCSAALGVLEAFDNENILDHSVLQGKVMRQKLDILLEENKYIGDVRGMGPMIGVEIVQNKKNKEPSKDTATKIVLKCKEEGLLLVTCGLDGNVIRFMGPLTTPIDQVEEAMDIFSRAVSSI